MEYGFGGIFEVFFCFCVLVVIYMFVIFCFLEIIVVWIKKVLDLGFQGIMFFMIDSFKEVCKVVFFCCYFLNGVCGVVYFIVRVFGYGIDVGYLSYCEEELLIMCQVELEDVVDKVEEIVVVDGVDCIQMGFIDLSVIMGYLWDFGNNKVREMMKRVEKVVLSIGGVYLVGFVMLYDSLEQFKVCGYYMVFGVVDIGFFRIVVLEDVNRFKMSLEMGEDDDVDDDLMVEGKDFDDKYWSE